MKRTFGYIFPIILIHLFVGFAAVFAFSMAEKIELTDSTQIEADESESIGKILVPFEYSFKLCTALIRFTELFPALLTAGLLIGFSIAFRKIIPETIGRWSPKILSSLINAFVACIICIGAYVLLAEWLAPALKNRQENILAKTESYGDYMLLARASEAAGNHRTALSNAEAALDIWEESPEATEIAEDARYALAEAGELDNILEDFSTDSLADFPVAQSGAAAFPRTGLSAAQLFAEAKKANDALDLYNAHYYAVLAWQTTPDNDPSKRDARRLASEAWNRITAAMDELRAQPDREWYERKYRGYVDIQSRDFLSAYYRFLQMDAEQKAGDRGTDPDIARFLQVAQDGLLQSFFFTDETKNLRQFEQSRDVFFTLNRQDGGKDVITMKGVTRQRAAKQDAAYLRDFEMLRFDAQNNLEFHIVAPYAKMFSFSMDGEEPRPQLILTAVDREDEEKRLEPQVLAGDFPTAGAVSKSVVVLEMPYKDINLLFAATAGPALMTLPELFYFTMHGEEYGMPRHPFLAEFIERLCDPFIVFTVAILILTWAWKFRLGKNRPFSAWWILVMPLVTVVCAYLLETARYVSGLCILFATMFPVFAVPIVLLTVALSFFAASLYFFSQRSD